MSSENPSKNLTRALEHKSPNPLATIEIYDGEITGPLDEDQRVLRKFEDLPLPVADHWRKMALVTRRKVVSDEQILKMSLEQMVDLFTLSNPQYRPPQWTARELDEKYDLSGAIPGGARVSRQPTPQEWNGAIALGDIEPKLPAPEHKRIDEIKQRLLGRSRRTS